MELSKLKREKHTRAVINTDTVAYKSFLAEVENHRKFSKAVNEVDGLKKEVVKLKQILKELLNGMNNNGKSSS